MYLVSIDDESCEGCGNCAEGCPAHILSFDGKVAFVSGDECDCMGCEACVAVCPSGAITAVEL